MTTTTANVLMVFMTFLIVLIVAAALIRCQVSRDECKSGCLKQTNRPVTECYLGCS